MKKTKELTGYEEFLLNIKHNKRKILFWQIVVLIIFLLQWEVLARLNIIDTFLFSKPSDIFILWLAIKKLEIKHTTYTTNAGNITWANPRRQRREGKVIIPTLVVEKAK